MPPRRVRNANVKANVHAASTKTGASASADATASSRLLAAAGLGVKAKSQRSIKRKKSDIEAGDPCINEDLLEDLTSNGNAGGDGDVQEAQEVQEGQTKSDNVMEGEDGKDSTEVTESEHSEPPIQETPRKRIKIRRISPISAALADRKVQDAQETAKGKLDVEASDTKRFKIIDLKSLKTATTTTITPQIKAKQGLEGAVVVVKGKGQVKAKQKQKQKQSLDIGIEDSAVAVARAQRAKPDPAFLSRILNLKANACAAVNLTSDGDAVDDDDISALIKIGGESIVSSLEDQFRQQGTTVLHAIAKLYGLRVIVLPDRDRDSDAKNQGQAQRQVTNMGVTDVVSGDKIGYSSDKM